MRRAFITGATGFVGAAVARALVAAGWDLRALARSGSDRRNLSGLPLDVVTGDLREPSSYAAALELENRGQALLTRTDDMPEALAAFKEKREPRFTGR